jgi:DNA-binding transcriptional LysR family regulator
MNTTESPKLAPAARLDIEAMRTVISIAQTRAVKLAAARLGRSPAALSMQLRKLEETLGRCLFERTRAGMVPTAACERLLPHAHRMIEAERIAREAFAAPVFEGSVRVGLIEDVGGVRFSEILADFGACYPGVSVEATVGSSWQLGAMLEANELDLAVLAPGAAIAWRPNDEVVHEEPLVWVVAKGSDIWTRDPLPLALASEGCAWRRATLEALEVAGRTYRIVFRSDAYEAITAAVLAGLAAAPLPLSRAMPGLKVLDTDDGAPRLGHARAVIRLGPQPNEATQALAERIREHFGTRVQQRGDFVVAES